MPGLSWPFVFASSCRMLRSDSSPALLDRNCESQLGSCSGHRSERHVFQFRTYLRKPRSIPTPPWKWDMYGTHLYKFIHVNVLLFSYSCLLEHVFELFVPYASIGGDPLQ